MARMWLGTRPAAPSEQAGDDAGTSREDPARDGPPGELDASGPTERTTSGREPFWRRLLSRRP